MSAPRVRASSAIAFDLVQIFLIGLWMMGGVPFNGHVYFPHGADPRRAALILGIIAYFLSPTLRERSFILRASLQFGQLLTRPMPRAGFFFAVFILAMGLGILQTLALRVPLYDVGLFHQVLWSLTHHHAFHSTISGAGNLLWDHFSPSLVLLAPFFDLSQSSAFFLPLAHVFLLFLGGASWVFLAARVPGCSKVFRSHLAAATAVFFLSFESLWSNLRWGFHENSIAFACTSWGLALLLGERNPKYKKSFIFLLFLIAAGSKEILLLDSALLFFFWGYSEWQKSDPTTGLFKNPGRFFSVLLFFSALLLVSGFCIFASLPLHIERNSFIRTYGYLGETFQEVSSNLFQSPLLIFEAVGIGDLAKYGVNVFLPWLFLPLPFFLNCIRRKISKDPVKGIPFESYYALAILPSFISAALATYPALRNPSEHSVLELWPVLACMTLIALARIQSIPLVWGWAILSLLRMDYDPFGALREYGKESQKMQTVRQQIQSYPENISVVGDDLLGPWVAGRLWVTRWPDLSLLPNRCPDRIVVRNSSSGTLTELGVQQLLSRCAKSPKARIPAWRMDEWAEYQTR